MENCTRCRQDGTLTGPQAPGSALRSKFRCNQGKAAHGARRPGSQAGRRSEDAKAEGWLSWLRAGSDSSLAPQLKPGGLGWCMVELPNGVIPASRPYAGGVAQRALLTSFGRNLTVATQSLTRTQQKAAHCQDHPGLQPGLQARRPDPARTKSYLRAVTAFGCRHRPGSLGRNEQKFPSAKTVGIWT